MGTDCPSLTRKDLKEAALALEQGADAVIGRGGWRVYTDWLKRFAPVLFESIPGNSKCLEETRLRLQTLGWKWHELPMRWDVDRMEDVGD